MPVPFTRKTLCRQGPAITHTGEILTVVRISFARTEG